MQAIDLYLTKLSTLPQDFSVARPEVFHRVSSEVILAADVLEAPFVYGSGPKVRMLIAYMRQLGTDVLDALP